jgi:hypothetical protein
MKPFADGEMVRECLKFFAKIALSEKFNIVSNISSSRFTVGRRIEEIFENIANSLQDKINQMDYISLAIDESCDITDMAQLAILSEV